MLLGRQGGRWGMVVKFSWFWDGSGGEAVGGRR